MLIEEMKKRRGRLADLLLDDGRTVTLDIRAWEESPYRVGGTLTEEQLTALCEEAAERRAREKALYLLSLRDHSRGELARKLRRDADTQTAEAVAERMEELGLVDDARYAERMARDLAERKLYPKNRIVQELRARGVDGETARAAAEELDCDDLRQALALIEKKQYNRRVDREGLRKTAAALGRYGFGADTIRRAVQALRDDYENESDEEDDYTDGF